MNEEKPAQKTDDPSLLFAERYGHVPLPNVSDYKLCHEFRNKIGQYVSDNFRPRRRGDLIREGATAHSLWLNAAVVFQKKVKKLPFNQVSKNYAQCKRLLLKTFLEGEFWEILSILEWVLRASDSRGGAHRRIRALFDLKLAPYAIDDSTTPICIIPLESPETAGATVSALEDVHKSGVDTAHENLRDAAGHINAEQYGDAIADSVHAVEAIAREMTGKSTLGAALTALKKQGLVDHDALKDGIAKLYGYASDTSRHGQPQAKAQKTEITRDEALLIFSTCAAIAGYLARKKMQMEADE